MNTEQVLDVFRQCGALLENGHFILSSGLRSPTFLQKAKVFQYPDKAEILCKALAEKVKESDVGPVDIIISPAVGGIIPGYETARHMQVPSLFVEREKGEFALRRGFEFEKGARILMVEDIVSTGLSSRECIDCIKALGGNVVAAACIVDRSAGEADVGVPLISLAQYKVPAYQVDAIPPQMRDIPAIKPGSRGLQ
ncbi:orotate phosphoribosyltransferase [Cohaesibacter gelatinilyticus]|uniref:Orotate phosphoribosyltransferase n=1 Tax=Cohaesibacter gelatinilyticus TaxID=372072 RepID=A0A285NCV2_9HYPH|nr:orotate phosphoribosyltransferase [Cohaesibacter gelatinilyticus]SNZ07322.1 orotate phosphoribosyltransferase [Cohaesibacter gelatinilyticus]HAT87436.1 orotate phosphoribosyltransferase [Hyphomicrobiales bacterium]